MRLAMSVLRGLVCLGGVLVRQGGMLFALLVIALAVVLGGGAVSLGGVIVMFGGFVMSVLGHACSPWNGMLVTLTSEP